MHVQIKALGNLFFFFFPPVKKLVFLVQVYFASVLFLLMFSACSFRGCEVEASGSKIQCGGLGPNPALASFYLQALVLFFLQGSLLGLKVF